MIFKCRAAHWPLRPTPRSQLVEDFGSWARDFTRPRGQVDEATCGVGLMTPVLQEQVLINSRGMLPLETD